MKECRSTGGAQRSKERHEFLRAPHAVTQAHA
jgi:hypothetical protein